MLGNYFNKVICFMIELIVLQYIHTQSGTKVVTIDFPSLAARDMGSNNTIQI